MIISLIDITSILLLIVDIQEVVCKLDLDHAATSPQVKEGVDGEESLRQSQARGRSSSSRLCLPAKVGSLLTH